jgi:hypothetical protein
MNRAERYAIGLVFVALIGSLLFFSAVIYISNYHVVSQVPMTVSITNGSYLAQEGIADNYPYISWKSQFFTTKEFSSNNASQVIQWAIDNTAHFLFFKKGTNETYYITTTIVISNRSNLYLDGINSVFIPGQDVSPVILVTGHCYYITFVHFTIDLSKTP